MIKQKIKYTDYNGNEQQEALFFHITKTEVATWEMANDVKFSEYLKSISKEENTQELWKTFMDLVIMAYGEKSIDGKTFNKSPEIQQKFKYSAACDALVMSFFEDAKKAVKFAKGIMPYNVDSSTISKADVAHLPEEQQKLILEADE